MMDLTPQFIVVCGPSTPSSLVPAVDCGAYEGVSYAAHVAQGHILTNEQYQALLVNSAPFDAVKGAELFAYGFGVVVGCWVIAHMAAVVVRAIKGF